jgi:glutamyl-tRNA reductase
VKDLLVTCAGLNHTTSPVEERERLALSPHETREAIDALRDGLGAVVILSTCNRTEIYTTTAAGNGNNLIDALNQVKGASVEPRHFYVLQHTDAVEHLYRVAAGIDSMVLGESQILGQVREAMSIATEAEALNGALSHVFHSAITTGRRARTETNIGGHTVSVSSATVALARRSLGDIENKTVLVISAGSMGKLAARALAQQSGSRILVANRTRDRAEDLASQLGPHAEALGLDHLGDALSVADIVISGTSSGEFILGPAALAPVMEARDGRDLLFIDIAVPRDIDPAVTAIPGVHLCDIDDIEAVTDEGWTGRQAEVDRVESIIGEEVARFEDWWASLDVVPVISALRERAEAVRKAEVDRTLARLGEVSEEDRQRIEAMSQAIVKKMLDRPISRLKDGEDNGFYVQVVEDLFDLPVNGRENGRSRGLRP